MSYEEAKKKYSAFGIDADAAITTLKSVPVSLHCWQGDDVRGFDASHSLAVYRRPVTISVAQGHLRS